MTSSTIQVCFRVLVGTSRHPLVAHEGIRLVNGLLKHFSLLFGLSDSKPGKETRKPINASILAPLVLRSKHPYETNCRLGAVQMHVHAAFSRMRSEGFPFIVGVWGWTCVRVVFLVSSSCRRRVVVASSSPTRRQLVNSLPLGGTFALRHHPVFQSMKSRGSLARNACFGAPKSQNVRSFSCFG